MALFNYGRVKLSSGKMSDFKIDCDALSDEDLDGLAQKMVASWNYIKFKRVVPIPTGGIRFAEALKRYLDVHESYDEPILIVDDVWTTGKSMNKAAEKYKKKGFQVEGTVIFARSAPDTWIMPAFIMDIL